MKDQYIIAALAMCLMSVIVLVAMYLGLIDRELFTLLVFAVGTYLGLDITKFYIKKGGTPE